MKTLNKISYNELTDLKNDIYVKKIYCLPVLLYWLNEEEIYNIDTKGFIDIWRKNWAWYFSEENNNESLEEMENILFSIDERDRENFEFLDYLEELWVYMFIDMNA